MTCHVTHSAGTTIIRCRVTAYQRMPKYVPGAVMPPRTKATKPKEPKS